MKTLLLTLFVLMMFLLALSIPSVSATHYNFSFSYIHKWNRTNLATNTIPDTPSTLCAGLSVLDDYPGAINLSDDVRAYESPATSARGCYQFNFTITEDAALVNRIAITTEGYVKGPTHNVSQAYIWNSTYWERLNNETTNGTYDISKQDILNVSLGKYITNSRIFIIYVGKEEPSTTVAKEMWMDFINLEVTQASTGTEASQFLNDSYVMVGDGLSAAFTVTGGLGFNCSKLQTNETGAWLTYEGVYGSPQSINNGTGNSSTFTWKNTTYCNKVLGVRMWYNDTGGNNYYTTINQTYLLPFISGSLPVRNNISTSACGNSTHINYTFKTSLTNTMDVWLDFVLVGANKTCPYRAEGFSFYNTSNQTDYCYFRGMLYNVQTNKLYSITRSPAVEFAAPPNIPNAIGATTVVVMIFIVVYVVKKKSEGW